MSTLNTPYTIVHLKYTYSKYNLFHKSKNEIDKEIKVKCKNVITLSLTVHYNIKSQGKKVVKIT